MSNVQTGSLWPDAIVKYEFDEAINTDEWTNALKAPVIEAMQRWMDRTNYSIVFRQVSEGPFDMDSVDIYYKNSGNDKASTEKTAEELADNVDLEASSTQTAARFHFSALHELGHVMGLTHEQNRSDRNIFLAFSEKCIKDNFPKDAFQDFGQYSISGHFSGPYNTLSIMHYSNCMGCLPNWRNTNTRLPGSLFCPPPTTQGSVGAKGNPVVGPPNTPINVSNQNQLTLSDGAGIIEAYRNKYNNITIFSPIFDSFPPPKEGSYTVKPDSEFLQRKSLIVHDESIISTPIAGTPAVVATRFKKQDAFSLAKCIFLIAAGKNRRVYIRKLKGPAGAKERWTSIGTPLRGALSEPVAVSLEDDSIDVFITDTKGQIFHCLLQNVNDVMRVGKWHQVPGAQTPLIPNLARPAVALNGDGSFSIFYTQGPSSPRIMTARIFATVDKVKLDINGWVPLDDNSAFRPTSSPSAVEYLDGTIAITAFGMMTLDGSFPTNESTSASVNNQSVDISNSIIPSATPYTCVWERTGSLIPTTCTGDGPAKKIGSLFWCPWTHFVGQINLPTTNPLITSSRNGMKSIYIRGRDGHLLRRWFTVGYGWDPYWWDLGGCMATDPGGCEQYVVASMGEHQTFFSTTSFNLVPVNVQPPITVQQPSDISDINLGFWCKMDGTNESDFPESPVP